MEVVDEVYVLLRRLALKVGFRGVACAYHLLQFRCSLTEVTVGVFEFCLLLQGDRVCT